MTHPPRRRLGEQLQPRTRFRVQERFATLRQEASAPELTSADCLDRRLTDEVTAQEDKPGTRRTVMARFPYRQTVERFDCGFPPSGARKKRQELATGRFIEPGDNVVGLGPPGPGKTPLALALGLQAVQQRYRTRCTAAMSRIAALTTADAETRLEERRKHDSLPKLLIIDERSSIPIAQHGAHRFFQLISRRYERGSIVLTSNQSFGQGGEVFGTTSIATAILARLRHHRVVINSTGAWYRLREKQKAGLLKKPEPSWLSSPRVGMFRAS
jgi:DNA replication protein DnaC